jgi:hypothetical protein
MADRKHTYHAEADVLTADLTLPLRSEVRPQAYVKIPGGGGYLSERAEDFRLESVISFESAYTQVAGNPSDKPIGGWVTLATSVVEGLNVLDVVTADRVVAQLSADHPKEGYVPKVTFLGTRFEGLKIAGVPITPVIDLDFCAAYPGDNTLYLEDGAFRAKVEKHRNTLGNDAGVREPYSGTMPDPGKLDAEWKRYIKEEQKKELRPDAFVTTSLVSSIKVEEGFEGKLTGSQYGNVIVVPEFGKIFLAELRVDCDSFELTMIRLKMGCFASGTMTASSGKMNGSTVP